MQGKRWSRNYILLNILIIIAGISLNMPLPGFKYIFLLSAILLSGIGSIHILKEKVLFLFIKNNWSYILFCTLSFLIIAIKRIIMLGNGQDISIITGFGEVVLAAFGLIFACGFSYNQKKVLMEAYVLTFATAFILWGKNTLYDYGNVCRTIGAYTNPNILALYASVAFFMSLLLVYNTKTVQKYIFVITSSISLACIIHTSSRAMYLALLIVCAIYLGTRLFAFLKNKGNCHIKVVSKSQVLNLILFVSMLLICLWIYYPKLENVVIDATEGEVEKVLEEENSQMANRTGVAFDRILNEGGLSDRATIADNSRFDIWKEYFLHIKEYFWFGNQTGSEVLYLEAYGRDFVAHNMLISTFYKYGIFVLFIFGIVLLRPFCYFITSKKVKKNLGILILALCAIGGYGMLHETTTTGVFWMIVGMAYGVKYNDKKQEYIKTYE